MSSRVKSQEHCLRVALWLVYHGHAIIISPVLLANAYILAPLSNLWLQPKVLQQFAIQFPKLNFAEVRLLSALINGGLRASQVRLTIVLPTRIHQWNGKRGYRVAFVRRLYNSNVIVLSL